MTGNFRPACPRFSWPYCWRGIQKAWYPQGAAEPIHEPSPTVWATRESTAIMNNCAPMGWVTVYQSIPAGAPALLRSRLRAREQQWLHCRTPSKQFGWHRASLNDKHPAVNTPPVGVPAKLPQSVGVPQAESKIIRKLSASTSRPSVSLSAVSTLCNEQRNNASPCFGALSLLPRPLLGCP